MILSGSVGFEPLLERARLSAHANILASDLKPWSEETATAGLLQLAQTCEIKLSAEVCREMCCSLRCCIPHHVQMFCYKTTDRLRRAEKCTATLNDVDLVHR